MTRFRAGAWLPNLLLALGSLAFVLLFLELALRLTGFASERQLATRRMVDAHWTRLLDCYPSNPRGYFEIDLRQPASAASYRRLAPNRFDAISRLHPWAVLSEYNSLRFREQPPAPRRAGVKRVAVFGDSFTEGQGVKQGDTVAPVLERLLDAAAPGRYEVRNCGRRGLDMPQLYDAFESSLQYEPDLVVYALVLNDAARPPEFEARQSYVNDWILDRENPADAEPAQPGLLQPRLFEFVRERLTAWRVGRATTRWYLEMWSDANPGWAQTQVLLRRMDARMRERGGKLVIAPWPLFVGLEGQYPFEAVHRRIAEFCRVSGIAHHELLDAFRGRRTSELWVHDVDRHPNEKAHRVAAEALAPVVLQTLDSH